MLRSYLDQVQPTALLFRLLILWIDITSRIKGLPIVTIFFPLTPTLTLVAELGPSFGKG